MIRSIFFSILLGIPLYVHGVQVKLHDGRIVDAQPTEYGFDVYDSVSKERIAEIIEDQPGSYLVKTRLGETRVPMEKSGDQTLIDSIDSLGK